MQVIDIIDTATGVRITHRALPALLKAIFFSASLVFVAFVLANVDLASGSWLPPFDRLPASARQALLWLTIGAGLTVMAWPVVRALKILLVGEVWEFDGARRRIIHNGRLVATTAEIERLRVEGDFRGDTSDITLDIVTRAGRKIEVAEASLDEAEFERFIDAARHVRARMKIPVEVVGLPSRAWGWRYPPWWNTQV